MSSNAIDLDDNRTFHASELAKFTIRATVLVKPYIEDAKRQALSVPQTLEHEYSCRKLPCLPFP